LTGDGPLNPVHICLSSDSRLAAGTHVARLNARESGTDAAATAFHKLTLFIGKTEGLSGHSLTDAALLTGSA
jgi:hypothetical protein